MSPVSEGAVATRVGSRNAPTAGYTAHIPDFREMPPGSGNFVGGQFVDGRADNLEDQARAPFLNPLEMNMADEAAVVAKLRVADYADDFLQINGANAFDDIDFAYSAMVTAIAAFERTDLFSPFASKFDAVMAGTETFTPDEEEGQQLFNNKAGCRRCHNTPGGRPQVFSDFRYTNIGVPPNPDSPFLILNPGFVDTGLGDVQGATHNGKFRAPTLRNVADTAPYMHNGVFDTLEEVMDFYNVRPDPPEVADNIENPGNATPGNIGNLNLTNEEIRKVIVFLRTLSDR